MRSFRLFCIRESRIKNETIERIYADNNKQTQTKAVDTRARTVKTVSFNEEVQFERAGPSAGTK